MLLYNHACSEGIPAERSSHKSIKKESSEQSDLINAVCA